MLFSAPMVPARHLGARRRLVIPSASEGLAQAVLITQATLCDPLARVRSLVGYRDSG